MNNNVENKKGFFSGFVKAKVLVIFLGLFLCLGYLFIINTSAVKGYEIKKVENIINYIRNIINYVTNGIRKSNKERWRIFYK